MPWLTCLNHLWQKTAGGTLGTNAVRELLLAAQELKADEQAQESTSSLSGRADEIAISFEREIALELLKVAAVVPPAMAVPHAGMLPPTQDLYERALHLRAVQQAHDPL